MSMFNKTVVTNIAAGLVLGGTAMLPATASADLSGNIGVHSMYLLRGIGVENNGATVQGGLDYSHESGLYAGWWGSNLGYSDAGSSSNGFENDFYVGYAGEMGGVGFDVGVIKYVYVDVSDSDLTELTAGLSMGDFSVGLQYLAEDGAWGNKGDIYWKAGYSTSLPYDFGLGIDLGWYTYDDGGPNATTSDSGFRHLNFTLSHPVGKTGADMYVQYTVAGEDRLGADYDNKVVVGLTYGFDI